MSTKTNWSSSVGVLIAVITATMFFQNCQNNGVFMDDLGLDEVQRNLSSDTTCADPFDARRTLSEGEWRVAFRTPSVAPDQYCHAEKRVCSNGRTFGSFRFETCSNEVTTGFCGSPFPGGNPVPEGASVRAFYVDANGACQSGTRTCSSGVLSGRGNLPACPGDPTCMLPWGLQLAEGGHILTMDRDGTPKLAGTCGKPYLKWTCTSGQLREQTLPGDCNPGACTAPWGERVANGSSVAAYKTEISTNCAGQKIMRTCNNGTLGGSSAYNRAQCFEDRNPCTLPWDNEKLAHGQSVNAYNTNVARNGSSCDRQTLTCDNGNLKGPKGTHKYKSCTVSTRSCTAPWSSAETYLHLQTAQGCTTETAYGNSFCNCTTIQCIDGTFTNPAWKYRTCVHTPANCKTPWGATVKDGDSIKAYRVASARSASSCNAASNTEMRVCQNGNLSGSYQNANCRVVETGGGDR